jgi:2-dehydropantoate 2-reductase
VVRHTAELDMLLFGEPDGARSVRCETLRDVLAGAGTTPVIAGNVLHELWSKFCGQSALASLTTLTRLDIGPLRSNEVSARLFRGAIAEAHAVGRAAVPDLPDDIPRVNWDFVMRFPPHMHASMLDDLNRGKPLENEYLSGDVVRLGQRYGVPTPIHSVLYAALKPIADGLEPADPLPV